MKIAVIYASKTGTTKKCAETLQQQFNNVDIVDIETKDIDISEYDIIIIGSNIRIGQINKKIKKLIKNNIDVLNTKLTAYYICCGFLDNYKSYFEKNISKKLLDSAITYNTFGGELDVSKQKGFDKFIVSMISKTEEGNKEIKLLENNIIEFVEKIRNKII